MEARLFPHSELGEFGSKVEDLRRFLDRDLRDREGTYFLTKLFDVPSNALALFEIKGTIVGCAVVHEAVREMTEEERHEHGWAWKAIMKLDPDTIWVWRREQDVRLKEIGIRFLPGPPMVLTSKDVLSIFRLVAERSR